MRLKDTHVWLATHCVCLMLTAAAISAAGANWPAWRGSEGSGVCQETSLPLQDSAE